MQRNRVLHLDRPDRQTQHCFGLAGCGIHLCLLSLDVFVVNVRGLAGSRAGNGTLFLVRTIRVPAAGQRAERRHALEAASNFLWYDVAEEQPHGGNVDGDEGHAHF